MNRFMLSLGMLCLFVNIVFIPACNDDDDTSPTPDIVAFVSDDPNFSLLTEAVLRAGVEGILSSEGPFTLFAPNNAAFEAFLAANPDWDSIDDIPADALADVLTNHVISENLGSTDLQAGYYSTASNTSYGEGINTSIYVETDGGVTLNGVATVTNADLEVSNGVIHEVNAVIDLPTVVTFATSNPIFSSLVAALTADGLTTDFVATLSGPGPFTVFAPTNDAFQALLDSNDDWNSLSDIPTETLETVLLYHVSGAGNVRAGDLSDGMMVPTLATDQSFTIDLSGETPAIQAGANRANIVVTDVQASNGVVHVIDTVILP